LTVDAVSVDSLGFARLSLADPFVWRHGALVGVAALAVTAPVTARAPARTTAAIRRTGLLDSPVGL
jgi:hypothetical protein